MIKLNSKTTLFIIFFITFMEDALQEAEMIDPIRLEFKGLTGTFDRASLQRGFQVYKEVCSSCHSMQYLSYRNLGEPGGPEFSGTRSKSHFSKF